MTGRGAIGIQSKKIDAARDTRAVMNGYFDPTTGQYNVPSLLDMRELATALSNMLSVGGGGTRRISPRGKGFSSLLLKGI